MPVAENGSEVPRRGLVDDENALPVAQVQHLLAVGIVAGAEGIGPYPLEQGDILYIIYLIKSPSIYRSILMFPKPRRYTVFRSGRSGSP